MCHFATRRNDNNYSIQLMPKPQMSHCRSNTVCGDDLVSVANHRCFYILTLVLGITLNCLHRAICLPHPGANDHSCWSAVKQQLSLSCWPRKQRGSSEPAIVFALHRCLFSYCCRFQISHTSRCMGAHKHHSNHYIRQSLWDECCRV